MSGAAAVFTHRRPYQTAPAIAVLREVARSAGATLLFGPDETRKHGLEPGEGVVVDADDEALKAVDLAFAIGGDGTVLTTLRRYAATRVPVYAVNFGELGFLATIEPEDVADGFARAFAGDFETLSLPALHVTDGREIDTAFNDVSIHRQPGKRVAQLAYAVGGHEVGRVRCDGLAVATPAGSTGYNLANGGPVLAWGVEGFVVSFIAPHSLTARALVVAPGDVLSIDNRSPEEPVYVAIDGRPAGELGPGEALQVRFLRDQGTLAQVPGTTFYMRLHEKFGRLVGLR